MKTIVIADQKGGVGKTTTAMALAYLLREEGKRTLLIDADQQGNATDTYRASIDGAVTLYDVILDNNRADILEAIQHTAAGDIIAGDPLLKRADTILADDLEGLYRLSDAIASLEGRYDYVVIDTGPSLNTTLYNCLVAADEVIIPVAADRYSIVGLSQLDEAICAVKRRHNTKLHVFGLLLVMYNERTIIGRAARETMEHDAEMMGTKLFSTPIRRSVSCQMAQAAKKPLFEYDDKCSVAQDYRAFFEEFKKALPDKA